jgi:hypothetical protein
MNLAGFVRREIPAFQDLTGETKLYNTRLQKGMGGFETM